VCPFPPFLLCMSQLMIAVLYMYVPQLAVCGRILYTALIVICIDSYTLSAAFCVGGGGGWEVEDNASFPLRRGDVVVICSCRQLTEEESVIWPPVAVVTRRESTGFVASRSDCCDCVRIAPLHSEILDCCSRTLHWGPFSSGEA
jgi:hypothetical protein